MTLTTEQAHALVETQKRRRSGAFCDLEVSYGYAHRMANRQLLAYHSQSFRKIFEDGFKGDSISMQSDAGPYHAFNTMMHYFETFDYDPDLEEMQIEEARLHAEVYLLADDFGAPGLKVIAIEKLKASVTASHVEVRGMLYAVKTLFSDIRCANKVIEPPIAQATTGSYYLDERETFLLEYERAERYRTRSNTSIDDQPLMLEFQRSLAKTAQLAADLALKHGDVSKTRANDVYGALLYFMTEENLPSLAKASSP